MSPVIKPAPVRREFMVEAAPQKAFDVFAAGLGRWWPASHKIGAWALKTAVLEPGVGGRWSEIDEDGTEAEWGRVPTWVPTWAPPLRLVLARQIGADFRFDPDLVIEVEVRFTAAGPGATRVECEHRDLERLGKRAAALREQLNGGWAGILGHYAGAVG